MGEVHQAVLIQRPVFKMNPSQELWAPKAESTSPPASPPRDDKPPGYNPPPPAVAQPTSREESEPYPVVSEAVEPMEPPQPLTPDSSQQPVQQTNNGQEIPRDLQVNNNPMAYSDPKAMTEKLVSELQVGTRLIFLGIN